MELLKGVRKVNIGEIPGLGPAIDLLVDFLGEVSKNTEVKAAVVIGSRARGNWRKTSDIDLVIVSETSIAELLPSIKGFGVIDPKPYTEQELIEGIIGGEVEIIEAFEEGKVLLDDGTWRKARGTYRKVKGILGIEKYKEGWRIKRKVAKEKILSFLKK